MFASIPHYLFEQAARRPQAVALRRKQQGLWRDIGYGDYAAQTRAFAAALLAMGLKPGQAVAIIGENDPEWLYADLGTQAVGGLSVGIYTTNAAPECAYILSHSEARLFVVENEEQLDKALAVRADLSNLEKIVVIDMKGLHQFKDPMVVSWEDFLAEGRRFDQANPQAFEARLAALKPQDTALLIYTSGTTGPPKGAMLAHANLVWTGLALAKLFGVGEKDEVVSFLPLSHIAERLLSIYLALPAGYQVNFVESPETVAANVAEVSPTLMFSVPRIWEKYQSMVLIRMQDATLFKRLCFAAAFKIGRAYAAAKLDPQGRPVPWLTRLAFHLADWTVLAKLRKRLGFERLRTAVSGAAAISPDVLRFFHALGVPLRQIYGQTEGSGPTTCHDATHIDPANAGPPIEGVEVMIAPDGEILVRGPNVFQGYFKNPPATAEALEDGWLHSGDVGEIDAKGFLRITDRKKDLIITSGGKNIAPQVIENQLKCSPYITDAIVIGEGRNYLTALLVIDEENVVKYATDHKIQYTTYATLTQTHEIQALIDQAVQAVNKDLARVEQIKRFTILPKKLLEEDGEVTPTMKVKRRRINEQFAPLIEAMYRHP
ncbi:MAG: AMP-binding protein [Rhodospirillales bacterium]|nr:AMP-binding protein [Rhodospirillales bacterium]